MDTPNGALGQIFAFERRQFLKSGLYPLPQARPFGYHLKAGLIFLFSLLLPISMIIKLLIGVDSLEEFADILYYLITQTAYLCKLINFLLSATNILRLEEQLRCGAALKYYDHFGRADLRLTVKVADIVAFVFRVSILGVIVLYALFPLFGEDRLIPFAGWIPVDVNVAVYQWLVYVVQVMCVAVSASTNGNLDILTIYLISIGISHLRLVKLCFSNVDYSLGHAQSLRERAENEEINQNFARKGALSPNNLSELFAFHKHTLAYLSTIELAFSSGIFIQFLASIGVVCLSGFQLLITPPKSGQFLMLLVYLSCMLCQVIMYCWFGNEVLVESDGIGDSCYMSNWYEGNAADKKCLLIVMERSKKQARLTAGKFLTMSLPTLVVILKSSYSYFAVLQRLYTDK